MRAELFLALGLVLTNAAIGEHADTKTSAGGGRAVAEERQVRPGGFNAETDEAGIAKLLAQWEKDLPIVERRVKTVEKAIEMEIEPLLKAAEHAKARGKKNLAGYYEAAAKRTREVLTKELSLDYAKNGNGFGDFKLVYRDAMADAKKWAEKLAVARKNGLEAEVKKLADVEMAAHASKLQSWYNGVPYAALCFYLRGEDYKKEIDDKKRYIALNLYELPPKPVQLDRASKYYHQEFGGLSFLAPTPAGALKNAAQIERLLEGPNGEPLKVKRIEPTFFGGLSPQYDMKANELSFRATTYKKGSRLLGQVTRAKMSKDEDILKLILK